MERSMIEISRDRALPLPGGEHRCVGLEIEFGGLTQMEAATVAQCEIGGQLQANEIGDVLLEGTAFGDVRIYLDTAFRKGLSGPLAQAGLDLSRAVVPVELVTEPLGQDQLAQADRLRAALRLAGATGTRDGVFLGFGLHLNVAVADDHARDVPATGAAFAFLEAWLRDVDPIDLSRRVLPFTRRYPRRFLDALAAPGPLPPAADFFALYAEAVADRNRGLDLLPIFRELDERRFLEAYGENTSVSARPAYHYRLPDCRIDEPDWSLAYEWNRWVLVERVAQDRDCLDALRAAWRDARSGLGLLGERWTETTSEILRGARAPETVR